MQFTPDLSGKMIKSTTTPKDKIRISFRKNSLLDNNNNQNPFQKDKDEKGPFDVPANKKKSVTKINKKFTNFLSTLNEIIEEYQVEYQHAFSSIIFSPMIVKYKELLNSYYKKKIDTFESFEDQIKELTMLIDGNENNESNNTIKLMIENLNIEKNKTDHDIQMEHDNEIQEFLLEESGKDQEILKNPFWKKINNVLKSKIQNLIINNEATDL